MVVAIEKDLKFSNIWHVAWDVEDEPMMNDTVFDKFFDEDGNFTIDTDTVFDLAEAVARCYYDAENDNWDRGAEFYLDFYKTLTDSGFKIPSIIQQA